MLTRTMESTSFENDDNEFEDDFEDDLEDFEED